MPMSASDDDSKASAGEEGLSHRAKCNVFQAPMLLDRRGRQIWTAWKIELDGFQTWRVPYHNGKEPRNTYRRPNYNGALNTSSITIRESAALLRAHQTLSGCVSPSKSNRNVRTWVTGQENFAYAVIPITLFYTTPRFSYSMVTTIKRTAGCGDEVCSAFAVLAHPYLLLLRRNKTKKAARFSSANHIFGA